MINKFVRFTHGWVIAGLLACAGSAPAQYFTSNKGDLLAGFRKTGSFQANYEVVVNLGNVTNYEALAAGTTVTISNFVPAQLVTNAFSSLNNLQWSVSAAFSGSSSWAGFPAATLWYTVARSSAGSQSEPPIRDTSSNQQQTRQRILSIGAGAATISSGMGATNINNDFALVREPRGDPNALTQFIGDLSDSTFGDLQGTLGFTIENTTPSSFSSLVRSDLYQTCPDGTTDPVTHLTTGSAYFVGYFQLNPDGTMSFTRASTSAPPPPPPMLSIARSNNVSTISFFTTNGVTYTLYFTNAAALSTPVTNWPSLPRTLSGPPVGGVNSVISFQDTNSASDRVYAVKVQ